MTTMLTLIGELCYYTRFVSFFFHFEYLPNSLISIIIFRKDLLWNYSFLQIFPKYLCPLLLISGDNLAVFDALIQLMESLTVPVECPQLRSCLVRTKESFRDPRTTTVILAWVERLIREGLNKKNIWNFHKFLGWSKKKARFQTFEA